MARLNTIEPADATGIVKALFDGVQQKLGLVPNMVLARWPTNRPVAEELCAAVSGVLRTAGSPARSGNNLPSP